MSRAERDKHLEHEGYETWDPNCRRCIEWGPVSDNAETREALRARVIAALDEALGRARDTSSFRWPQQEDVPPMADAVLAALPPVAGPEVRPDETLRRFAELLGYLLAQYERVVEIHAHVVMDTAEDRELHDRAVAQMRAAADPVRAALASPAPTDQEERV